MMKTRTARVCSCCCSAASRVSRSAPSAMAAQVAREQDIVDLRLGQRILVDDGSCPAGQIKEVSARR